MRFSLQLSLPGGSPFKLNIWIYKSHTKRTNWTSLDRVMRYQPHQGDQHSGFNFGWKIFFRISFASLPTPGDSQTRIPRIVTFFRTHFFGQLWTFFIGVCRGQFDTWARTSQSSFRTICDTRLNQRRRSVITIPELDDKRSEPTFEGIRSTLEQNEENIDNFWTFPAWYCGARGVRSSELDSGGIRYVFKRFVILLSSIFFESEPKMFTEISLSVDDKNIKKIWRNFFGSSSKNIERKYI